MQTYKGKPVQQVPAPVMQRCTCCGVEMPLDSENFKPTKLMPTGFGKQCYRCLRVNAQRKRADRKAAQMTKDMANLQHVITNSKEGSPLEGELLAHLIAKMGGLQNVVGNLANDMNSVEQGSATCLRKWELFVGMVKRDTDRRANKTDIRNMSTERIREELNKKIREAIGGVMENGVIKLPEKKSG